MKSLLALLLVAFTATAFAADGKLIIRAGNHDRSESIVSFTAPDEWKGRRFTIHELGTALQVDESGRAVFLLNKLPRGESLTCTLAPALPGFGTSGIFAKKDGTALEMRDVPVRTSGGEDNSRTIFRYQMEAGPVPKGTAEGFAHGAHLHPAGDSP